MSDPRLWQVEESFKDLHRIYKPDNLDKFTKEFVKKYKVPKGYEAELKKLVEEVKTNG